MVVDVGTDLETVTMVVGPVKTGADVCGIEAAETAAGGAVEWPPLPKVQPDAPTVDKTMVRAATQGCMPSEMVGWFGQSEPSRATSFEMFGPGFGSGPNRDHLCGYAPPRGSLARPVCAQQLRRSRSPRTFIDAVAVDIGVA